VSWAAGLAAGAAGPAKQMPNKSGTMVRADFMTNGMIGAARCQADAARE